MKYILILILTAFTFIGTAQLPSIGRWYSISASSTMHFGDPIGSISILIDSSTSDYVFSIDTTLLVGLHKSNTTIEQYSRLDNPPYQIMKTCTTAPTTDGSFTKVLLEHTYMKDGVEYFVFITAQKKCTVCGKVVKTRLLYYR